MLFCQKFKVSFYLSANITERLNHRQDQGMKICHLTTVHKQYDVRIFHKECTSLARQYETHLVVVNGSPAVMNRVQVHSINFKHNIRLSRIWKAVNLMYQKAVDLDCDVYHIHDPELLRIAVKLKARGKEVVYDAHEDVPRQILGKYWIPLPFRKLTSVIFEFYENKRAKQLSYVVTSTPHIRNRFIKINPNTVDIANYPILEKSRNIVQTKEKGNDFCYVGGIDENRGIRQLVRSFHGTTAKLKLAGEFSPDSFKRKVAKQKGWENVEHLGFLNRIQVRELMNDSLAGFVTLKPLINYMDSLPVKMFEYMSMGLPVIASDFPLWKEIIEKNNCGICVNPMNPNEIRNAITHLLENEDVVKEMGGNGLRMVTEKFNWAVEEQKLIKLYSEFSEKRPVTKSWFHQVKVKEETSKA